MNNEIIFENYICAADKLADSAGIIIHALAESEAANLDDIRVALEFYQMARMKLAIDQDPQAAIIKPW